jgi:hypothetical protein
MTDENVPALQFVQAMDELAPSTGEYVPVGQLAHLSGSVQRSRNSVPYMMNLANDKVRNVVELPVILLTVKPKYNNGSEKGINVLLRTGLYEERTSLSITDACCISLNETPSVLP